MATRVKASVVDRTAVGGRVCAIIGPLALREPEAISKTFARLAAEGPGNRFGLHPFPARRWVFDPSSPNAWSVRREADSFDPDDAGAELSRMMGESPAEPISIRLKGEYALFSYDHGIGDAHFSWSVPTLLTGDEDDAIAHWPRANLVRPIPAALRHAGGRKLVTGFRQLVRDQRSAPPDSRPVKAGPLTVGPKVVLATSGEGYAEKLRTANAGASVVASIIAATTKALRRNGIDQHSNAGIVVDLRRYLPDGAFTLANLMSWVEVSAEEANGAHDVHRQLQAALGSHRSLVHFSLGTALQSLGHIPAWTAWDVQSTARARLAFSDFRTVPALGRYAWAASSSPRLFAIGLPLGFRDQISVSITAVPDGVVQLGATFYASAFEAAPVRRALTEVLSDPQPR